jgi:hypothetical protein
MTSGRPRDAASFFYYLVEKVTAGRVGLRLALRILHALFDDSILPIVALVSFHAC